MLPDDSAPFIVFSVDQSGGGEISCLKDMQPVKKQYDIILGHLVNMVYWYMEHFHICAWSMVLEGMSFNL